MNFLIFPFDVSKNDSSSGWFISHTFEVKTAAHDKVIVIIAGQLNMLEANESFTGKKISRSGPNTHPVQEN